MRRTFTLSLKVVLVVFLFALLANLLHASDHVDTQQSHIQSDILNLM